MKKHQTINKTCLLDLYSLGQINALKIILAELRQILSKGYWIVIKQYYINSTPDIVAVIRNEKELIAWMPSTFQTLFSLKD